MKLKNCLYLGSALFLASCNDLQEMNVNPNQPADAQPTQFFTTAQYNFSNQIWDDWNNGRMGMYYAQYWSSTYYSDESRYLIREGTNQTMWNALYADVLKELVEMQRLEREIVQVSGTALQKSTSPNRVAIAEIMKTMVFHYISDIYGGPIPYSQALDLNNATPAYDSGEAVYDRLLATLEEQLGILNTSLASFESGDVVYGGNIANWKKFANSLRMRIALRMIDVKPAEARAAIAKSLDPANGGIISSNAESALFRYLSGAPNNNPLNEAFKTRVDFAVSGTLVDYLNKYEDPRLAVYAEPVRGTNTYVGEIYGLRQGDARQSNGDPTRVSLPSADFSIAATAPAVWLDYAEVEFMLAEIEARSLGLNTGGTAEEHYENGIRASFEYTGLSTAAANAYIENVPYVPARWKDAIGSQKWIAMYMQGIQGWLERMRLDFKDPYTGEEIFVTPAGGSLDQAVTTVPYRMSYPVTEASLNATNYAAAVQLLGGNNSKGAKPWWDVN